MTRSSLASPRLMHMHRLSDVKGSNVSRPKSHKLVNLNLTPPPSVRRKCHFLHKTGERVRGVPEHLECEVLQKARYINILTGTYTFYLYLYRDILHNRITIYSK